jgi:flavin-dependent dehydrogenase
MGTYGKGTPREGAPWFEALKDESGWAWFIPLHDGKTSVGIVMNQDRYNSQVTVSSKSSSLTQRYLANLHLAPGVIRLLSGKNVGSVTEESDESFQEGFSNFRATLEPGSVRSASDFSYSAPNYAGNGYRIVGDAGGE